VTDTADLQFRTAQESDLSALVSLLSADVSGTAPNDPGHDIPLTFHCPAARIFVVELNGAIVATLTASWNGRNGEFRYFWIDSALRGTPRMAVIFDGLFALASDYLRAAGMRRVLFFLRRDPEISRLQRLYERKLRATIVDPVVMVFRLDE
jgi:hypothetical protein